jgi:[protein-PII] uridylyltransferase
MLGERQKILHDLQANKITGKKCGSRLSAIMDKFLIALAAEIFLTQKKSAILALGGYGRGELCPYSDIDLLFLIQDDLSAEEQKNIERFLYTIWDSGIKIGHAVRSVQECLEVSREDPKALSNLLDARIIWGDVNFFVHMMDEIKDSWASKTRHNYTQAKLEERDLRHRRLGDTRYVLEPNIKEGKGGLRDFQTLFWITQVLYEVKTPAGLARLGILKDNEKSKFRRAHDFLLTVRCHLHDLTGRAEERLHFDAQPALAKRLGYTNKDNAKAVERFMKHYFRVTRDIGDLTRIVCAAIDESTHKSITKPMNLYAGYVITNDRLNFEENLDLNTKPIEIIRLFRIAQKTGLDIHPAALRQILKNTALINDQLCRDKEANTLFLQILCDRNDSYVILKRMNEAGVLERFIPEFRRAIALMQFDRYHMFTVDEHTLNAIDVAHRLESGALKDQSGLASAIIHTIKHRRVLFVALLLHDLCKGRGGNHEQLGAELALKLCPRLGLDDTETRLCSWLIFDHLFMSHTAFKRDLSDPKTIHDFLFRVHDIERLNLLCVFTIIDIMAVGPGRYSAWKEGLLLDLYYKAEYALHGKSIPLEPPMHTSENFTLPETMPAITIEPHQDGEATLISVIAPDSPGLFAKLAGALSAARINILEARIHTLDNNYAYDIFTLQNASGKPLAARRYKEIRNNIEKVLDDNIDPAILLDKAGDVPSKKDMIFDIPCGVILHSKASNKNMVLEIYGRDRLGLLYDVACLFRDHKFNIKSAKINTYGLKATDVFYLDKKDQTKAEIEELIHALRDLLLKGFT